MKISYLPIAAVLVLAAIGSAIAAPSSTKVIFREGGSGLVFQPPVLKAPNTPELFPYTALGLTTSENNSLVFSGGMGYVKGREPEWAHEDLKQSYQFAEKGDQEEKAGDLQDAQADYQKALAGVSNNMVALRGMAKSFMDAGDYADALKYYRMDVYAHNSYTYGLTPGDGFQDNDIATLMRYAIVLEKTDHPKTALAIYQRAAGIFSDPARQVKLPLTQSDGDALTTIDVEALATLAIGVQTFGEDGYATHRAVDIYMQALDLDPNSSVINYYLGNYWSDLDSEKARFYLQRAVKYGDSNILKQANIIFGQLP